MKLRSIDLRNFRNIAHQKLSLNSGLNVFRGPNGQGKTNFVEAVYLLSHGKSFRTSENNALTLNGDTLGTRIFADLEKKKRKHQIEFVIKGGKKRGKVNNKTVSGSYLRQNFPSVLFSPESLQVVKQSPSQRRTLIDDLALSIEPGFAQVYEDCTRLLKQKNALLKQMKNKEIDMHEGHRVFNNVTDLFFAKSARLTACRLNVIGKIQELLQKEFANIMGDSMVELEIEYVISGQSATDFTEEEIVNALYKRWNLLSTQEVALGQALVGPHKHDIQFHFNGQEARLFCSQGQQRAIILAFKMAHIRLHWAAHEMYPLLLLDDVLSELDQIKQTRFLEVLVNMESQILLTTTDASLIPKKVMSSVFDVELGTFKKHEFVKPSGGPFV